MSDDKRGRAFELRDLVLALMRRMARECFVAEPLVCNYSAKELETRLVAMQSGSELNAVWSEQARMRVQPAMNEVVDRYFRRLIGSLRFVDQTIPKDKQQEPVVGEDGQLTPLRKRYHVPVEIQDAITDEELAVLKQIGEEGGGTALFKRVVIDKDETGLTANQIIVLRDIHTRSLAKYSCPDFGGKEDFTLQLHIDYRMLPGGKKASDEALNLRQGGALILEDDKNIMYRRFLDISGIYPREARIRIPLAIDKKIAKRISSTSNEWSSLILELGESTIGARLVCGKPVPKTELELSKITVALSRDFGYANTVSLSVLQSGTPVDLGIQKAVLSGIESKEEAQSYIESHYLPADVKVVERVRIEGRSFLNRLNTLCEKIDGYKSRIDLSYNELDKTKAEIVKILSLKPEELITKQMKKSAAGALVGKFFQCFGQINDLRTMRKKLYRKISAIKKCWFGYVSNIELALAKKYHAVLVREHLTVEAIEKDAPDYKGRAFNKMLNYGSKGQYQNKTTDKFQWNGIPEIEVGSWYTSRACLTHSQVIEKKHRQGEKIYIPCCDKHDHADEYAADTIGGMLFLRPLTELA